jgi:hypothetical protein
MKKEETPRRKFVLRVATEIGYPSWSPIRRFGEDSPPGISATGTDLASSPDAVADPRVTAPAGSEAER